MRSGLGRGSKAAAANLSLRESSWSLNFFSSGQTKYWDGGGNGAAMRVQPHVWQNHSSPHHAFIPDVIRNSICTHGHPRAIFGAIVHAALLHETLRSGAPVRPTDWAGLGEAIGQIGLEMLFSDPELPLVWVPSWERFAKRPLKEAWAKTIEEWIHASSIAADICGQRDSDLARAYTEVLKALNAFDAAERGSGLKTPLYASALAWIYRDQPPEIALATAANVFGSDTDTIATMAGALIGALARSEPSGPLQDASYIASEAARLYQVGRQEHQLSFAYPDLLSWNTPKSQSDAWVSDSEGERLSGIGRIRPVGPLFKPKRGTELVWQWAELEFGQTVLVKRRAGQTSAADLREARFKNAVPGEVSPADSQPAPVKSATGASQKAARQTQQDTQQAQLPLVPALELVTTKSSPADGAPRLSIDALSQQCIRGGFDPTKLGEALLALLEGPDAIERAIGFVAIIAKAKVVRSGR